MDQFEWSLQHIEKIYEDFDQFHEVLKTEDDSIFENVVFLNSLEIDEMPLDVQNRVLGINENKAISLKDFAKRYNGILKIKKLKKKVSI